MSDVVIRARGLGKKYSIGHQLERDRFPMLRTAIANGARGVLRKANDVLHGRPVIAGDEIEEFWALKDVDFDISRGEVVGIIGRNGAGKSTLLKVLSRITDPSEGRVEIEGRVASLLEVGTGFHFELTGRENIFLNGSILGMTRAEIRRKFDEIVAFAGVEKFLDTPVKHYSSGMYVRLAFGVAAHLEPEILVVDEVLAVGDIEFQQRCLGKMQEVANTQGRTVLLVSHNMTAISTICSRGLLLNAGRLVAFRDVQDAISAYLADWHDAHASTTWSGQAGDDDVRIVSAAIRLDDGGGSARSHEPIPIELIIEVGKPVFGLVVAWELWSAKGQLLGYSGAEDSLPPPSGTTEPGLYRFVLRIPPNTLAAGSYLVALDVGIHNVRRIVATKEVALALNIENVEGVGRRHPNDTWINVFRPAWPWSRELLQSKRTLEKC
jgi:lipopolysaccharide transport system ATP-binding protein